MPCNRDAGMTLPGKGKPVSGSLITEPSLEKSPVSISGSGTRPV